MVGIAVLVAGPSGIAYFFPIPYPFGAIGMVCLAIPSCEAWQNGLRATFRQGTAWLMALGALAIWVAGALARQANPSFWNP